MIPCYDYKLYRSFQRDNVLEEKVNEQSHFMRIIQFLAFRSKFWVIIIISPLLHYSAAICGTVWVSYNICGKGKAIGAGTTGGTATQIAGWEQATCLSTLYQIRIQQETKKCMNYERPLQKKFDSDETLEEAIGM